MRRYVYEVTVPKVYDEDLETCVGIDMGVSKQITMSNGESVSLPDMSKLEAKRKRYQRRADRQKGGNKWKKKHGYKQTDKVLSSNRRKKTLRKMGKWSHKIANVRDNHAHHITRDIASKADIVVTEDLNIVNMTKRARGKNVSAKSGLNRSILHNGWGGVKEKLAYKSRRHIRVDPRYTSQVCNKCGHVESGNRRSQSEFECKGCGHRANADVNAAKNVAVLGMRKFVEQMKFEQFMRNIKESKVPMASVDGATGRRMGVNCLKKFSLDPSINNMASSFSCEVKLRPIDHSVLKL